MATSSVLLHGCKLYLDASGLRCTHWRAQTVILCDLISGTNKSGRLDATLLKINKQDPLELNDTFHILIY